MKKKILVLVLLISGTACSLWGQLRLNLNLYTLEASDSISKFEDGKTGHELGLNYIPRFIEGTVVYSFDYEILNGVKPYAGIDIENSWWGVNAGITGGFNYQLTSLKNRNMIFDGSVSLAGSFFDEFYGLCVKPAAKLLFVPSKEKGFIYDAGINLPMQFSFWGDYIIGTFLIVGIGYQF